ncbi:MAG TPA: Holliday junction resolvase [Candidatus Woesearchaeota archaeon]|nr:Holliday junction resolvase [Candidatus Woesearchaeota archaeon]
MINRKRKGTNAERELVHLFWSKGWPCVRVAGSGSIRYPVPDILVSNGLKPVAIEIKIVGSGYKYFSRKEIDDLILFSSKFGAMPFVAVKFSGSPWLFVSVENLVETPHGFSVRVSEGEVKGMFFEDFIDLVDSLS